MKIIIVFFITLWLAQLSIAAPNTAFNAISKPASQAFEPSFGSKDIVIIEGEVRTIGPFKASRVAVGDGNLIQVQLLDSGEILLIGKKKGTTSLRLWLKNNQQKSFRITITDKAQAQDITMRKIISTKVRIIEFRQSSLKKIGIDWSKTASGPSFFFAKDFIKTKSREIIQDLSPISLNPVGLSKSTPIFLGSNIALESTISFMQSVGHAATLAAPTLSCLSGESAQFLAGGEVPFTILSDDGTPTVSFKDYGIKLEIQPKADRHGRISTAINTEVSSIDNAVSVNGAPGFISRKTSTHMNVMSGQTIIISGLMTKNSTKDIEYIPGLAHLPMVGKAFQTQTMNQNQTHLVVFLTPKIIDQNNFYNNKNTSAQEKIRAQQKDKQLNTILDMGMADITIQFEE